MAPLNSTTPTPVTTQATENFSKTFQEFKTKFLSLNNLNTTETMDFFQKYRKEVNERIAELNNNERAIIKEIVTMKYHDITHGTNTASEKFLKKEEAKAVENNSIPQWGKKNNALNDIPDEDLTPQPKDEPAPEPVKETPAEEKKTGPVEVVIPPMEQPKAEPKKPAKKTTTKKEADAKRVEELKEEYKEIDKENFKENQEATPASVTSTGTKYTISRRINVPVNDQAYTNNEVSFTLEGENLNELITLEQDLIKHEILLSLDVNKFIKGEKKDISRSFNQTQATPNNSGDDLTAKKNARFKNFLLDLYADNLTEVSTANTTTSLSEYMKQRFADFISKNPIE